MIALLLAAAIQCDTLQVVRAQAKSVDPEVMVETYAGSAGQLFLRAMASLMAAPPSRDLSGASLVATLSSSNPNQLVSVVAFDKDGCAFWVTVGTPDGLARALQKFGTSA